jgi:hypothetical protein
MESSNNTLTRSIDGKKEEIHDATEVPFHSDSKEASLHICTCICIIPHATHRVLITLHHLPWPLQLAHVSPLFYIGSLHHCSKADTNTSQQSWSRPKRAYPLPCYRLLPQLFVAFASQRQKELEAL